MSIKFNLKKVILVALVYASLDVMWAVYNAYVPIFLQAGNPSFTMTDAATAGFGFGPSTTGFLLTLDNILALFIGPLVGMWSDSSRSKMGRRKPFILFAMPFMVIALILMPLVAQMIPAELSGKTEQLTGYLVPFMIFLGILLIANAIMFGPGRTLMFDITPSEKRTTANAVGAVADTILMILVIFGGAALYKLYHPLPLWVAAAFILVAVLIVWIFVKEPQAADTGESEGAALNPKAILQVLRDLPAEDKRSLLFYCLTLLLTYLGLSNVQAFLTSYAVTVLGFEIQKASLLQGAFAICSVVVSIPAALLANRIGRKRLMIIGMLLVTALGLVIFFAGNPTLRLVSIFALPVGWIFAYISHTPMITDHAPSGKYLATYVSILYTTTTLGLIIGPILGGWLVERFNNDYNLIWIISTVFFGLGIFTLLPVTKGEAKKEPQG